MEKTIISAEYTIDTNRWKLLKNHAVLIEHNRINDAGDLSSLKRKYPTIEVFEGEGLLMAPTFINAHDHGRAIGTTALGIQDSILEEWIPQLSMQPGIDPYDAALYDGLRLLASGVGSVVHQHNPRNWENLLEESRRTIDGYLDAGIRVLFNPPFIDQNNIIYHGQEEFLGSLPAGLRENLSKMLYDKPLEIDLYLDLVEELMNSYESTDEENMVSIQLNPAGAQWCSDNALLEFSRFAESKKKRIQMHVLETKYQAKYAYKKWNKSIIKHLHSLGILSPDLTCAHMVWVEPDDIPLLRDTNTRIVTNPSSNLRLRSGLANVPDFMKAGITLGVGIDGHGFDDDQDFLRELRATWFFAQRPGAHSTNIIAADILRMATIDGFTTAFGENHNMGSLKPGSYADMVLIDFKNLKKFWVSPEIRPFEVLLHHAQRKHVLHVMVNGIWRIRNGQSTGIDEASLESRIINQIHQPRDFEEKDRINKILPYIKDFYTRWD